MNQLALVSPQNPILGMEPDIDPAALPASRVRELLNLRTRSGALTVRRGMTRLADPPAPGAEIRGSWRGYFAESLKTFVAFRVGSTTRIYRLRETDEDPYDEITSPSVSFSFDGPVTFASIRDTDPENAADLLVANNFHDSPLVYSVGDQSYLGPGIGANSKQPSPGPCIAQVGPQAWWQSSMSPSATDATKVELASGYGFTLALKQGLDPNGVVVTVGFNPTDMDGGSTFDLTDGLFLRYRQLDQTPNPSASTDFFQYVSKLEIRGTASGVANTWVEIPLSFPQVIRSTTNADGTIESERSILLDTTGIEVTGANQMRFTLRSSGTIPAMAGKSVAISFDLKGVATTGRIPGNSRHAFAFAKKPGRGESVPVLCKPVPVIYTMNGGGAWPIEEGIGSRFVCFCTVWSSDYGEGRHVVLYRSEVSSSANGPSAGPFFRVKWEVDDADGGNAVMVEDVADYPNPSAFEAPDFLYENVRPSHGMRSEAGRLFAPLGSELWIGDAEHPLRFRRIPRVDEGTLVETSALTLRFPGEEVRALHGVGAVTGANGLSPIVVLTSHGSYRVTGSDASDLARAARIGADGCVSSKAIAMDGDRLYWLGTDGRLIATDGASTVDLSTGVAREWIAARQSQDARLDTWGGYLRVFPSGKGYAVLLDTSARSYLADDLPNIVATLDEGDRWIGWSEDGALWRLDDPSAEGDGNDPIQVAVRFRETDGPGFASGLFERVGLRADSAGAGNWKIEARDPCFDDAWQETVRGDGEDWRGLWRWTTPQAVGGGSILVDVAGYMKPGVRLRSVVLELDRGETRADTNPGVEGEVL